ncbi:MAG: PaaX domain-containing protein, C- domain protein [Actinomycetota bacterium]|nr:PaaX domain-containing protein, C- domain protein [Actinomycetota bacterium]
MNRGGTAGTGEVVTATDRRRPPGSPDLGLRPLTARSVIASVLLGTHPPILAVKALVQVGELFGIAEGTMRVALSRMVADGELITTDAHYRLGPRLADRQTRQDRGRWPEVTEWFGSWEIVLGTEGDGDHETVGAGLDALHLAWAGGRTWLRPANLIRASSTPWPHGCLRFEGRPVADTTDDRTVAASLWDLDGWGHLGSDLIDAYHDADDPAERFVVAAAILRHLRTDPLLPDALIDGAWPARGLRQTYEAFAEELHGLMVASVHR